MELDDNLRLVYVAPTDTTLTYDECSADFTCECPRCHTERLEAVARGVRPRKPQPWDHKRAA